MRGRFGRRRGPGGSETPRSQIDPRALERLAEEGVLSLRRLEERRFDGVPESFARIGLGEAEDGTQWVVGVSPASGGDALLGVLAAAVELAREGFRGRAAAVASAWGLADRRRLGCLAMTPLPIQALSVPARAEDAGAVRAEYPQAPVVLPTEQVASQLGTAAARALFARGVEGLRGLAAKHGGAVRGTGAAVELVILARRVARLRADDDRVVLETLLPSRSEAPLVESDLAEALDRLEGYVRKRLSDRGVRDGEEGWRGRLIGPLAEAAGLRAWRRWPIGGLELDVLDLLGVGPNGAPVAAALRQRLSLHELGRVLDAVLALDGVLPVLLADAEPPVRFGMPRLVLAAERTDAAVDAVLTHLALASACFDVREGVGGPALVARGETPHLDVVAARPVETRAPATVVSPGPAPGPDSSPGPTLSPSRQAGGRRRRRGRGGRRPGAEEVARAEETAPEAAVSSFEEVSLFDLDDDGRSGGEAGEEPVGPGRRRRGRRRGRGGAARGSETRGSGAPPGEDEEPRRPVAVEAPRASRVLDAEPEEEEDGEDGEDGVVPLAPDAPEIEEDVEASYDASELQEEPLTEGDRLRLERERRRLARMAKAGPPILAPAEGAAAEPEAAQAPRLPRGRAAILAHADRDSIAAAVLLARDVRQVEGLWIYPQAELMTFFRSVCTDLRENTPIYVIGFTPTPARDAIQAASLYRDRLLWFDRHVWPPEDLGGMSQAIGSSMLEVLPGCDSSIPLVLARCTRRSRFTDKLVDLVTGRFSQHDFERWGRVWWARIGQMLERTGDRRADVELLLAGRPSDLSREASRVAAPPPPVEIEFVSSRDFRLVHFGGLSMVLAEVPVRLNLHLCARIVRERYAAPISLAWSEGGEVLVLGADDPIGRRAIDVGGMLDHLAGKFAWIEPLPDADHVARFRLAEFERRPERLEEVISEIAMGRSILEG